MGVTQTLRDRMDPVLGRGQPRTQRTGAIILAVLAVLVVFGSYASVTGYLPFVPRGGHLVRADFSSAFNLNTSTPVRIHGVSVGEVDSIHSRDGGRSVEVTMRVDDTARKLLRADAHASIWQRLVLGGNEYIELTPGASRSALGGTTIPLRNTTTQVAVDQVLDALKPDARQGLRGIFKGVKEMFAEPPAAQQALPRLAPGLRPLAPAVRALRGTRPGDLPTLISGFDGIARGLDADEAALGGIVDGAQATFAVTAARRADLSRLLHDAPGALRTTRAQLGNLDATLDILDPLSRELLPGAHRLAPALAAITPALATTHALLAKARPLVDDLDPAVVKLHGAARQGVPLMRELQGTLSRTNGSLLPFLFSSDNAAHLPNYQLPGPTVAAVDSLAGLFDGNGHVAHFNGSFGSRAFHDYSPCSAYLTNPDPSKHLVCENLIDFFTSFLGSPKPSTAKLVQLGKLLGVHK